MRFSILVFCLLAATACDEKGPVGPSVPLNQRVTLAPGETASVEDTAVRVQFVRVASDSRCPADAICVWAGDAIVQIRAFDGGAPADYELHTGDASRKATLHGRLRIEILELQPYPFASRPPTTHDQYRATLRVTRP